MRAAERPRGKCQRGQKAIEKSFADHGRINCRRERKRNHRTECRGHSERQGGARCRTYDNSSAGDQHCLREHQDEDCGAGRSQRFHGRYGLLLALDKAADRIGDANPADDKGREPHEGQKFGEPVEIAGKLRGNVTARANVPSSLGEFRFRRFDQCRNLRIVRRGTFEADTVQPFDERAGLEQTGRL